MFCKCSIESVKVNVDNLELEFVPVEAYCIENKEKFYALFSEKEEDLCGAAKLIPYEIDKKLKAILKSITNSANVIYASMFVAAKTGGGRVLLNVKDPDGASEIIGVALV